MATEYIVRDVTYYEVDGTRFETRQKAEHYAVHNRAERALTEFFKEEYGSSPVGYAITLMRWCGDIGNRAALMNFLELYDDGGAP